MAWRRVLTKKINGYNVNLGIDYDDSSFTTTSVKCRTVIEKTSATWYDDRFACNGGVFNNFTCKDNGTGSGSWPYYREFYLNKGATAGSFSTGHFYCACTGNSYNWGNYGSSRTDCGTATINAPSPAIVVKPSVSGITINSIGDKSAKASFSVTSNGNGTISTNRLQISETNFGTVLQTINSTSGTFTGLTPNKTYYVRGYSTNQAGTTYTAVKSFTTSFIDPGAPGKPALTYDFPEPIPRAKLTAKWAKANNGSTAVAGYRIRLFKNNKEVFSIDTENTNLSYTFNSFESYGFEPKDIAKVGIYAYSKDWAGNKHFNGGGASTAQVFSDNLEIVSDKYIWISQNGSEFIKHKMYVSQNGSQFKEIRKEHFEIIK